jgi:hypothetical protein
MPGSVPLNAWSYYQIAAGASHTQIVAELTGLSSDVDLYVRAGSLPTTGEYDCRPYDGGTSPETCTLPNSGVTTWYIGVRGYTAGSYTIEATLSEGGGGPTVLENGVPVPGLSGDTGSEVFYQIEVPGGATNLQIQISGGTGDCDVYVRYGALPTTSEWDYRPYLNGNNETVTISSPAAGSWYIMLRGYAAYSGVTLSGLHSSAGDVTELENGVPVSGLAGAYLSEVFYKIEVPGDAANLQIQISGGTGDADRPYKAGNNETVTVSSPSSGSWYIMLRGYQAYSGVTLSGQY